jgi:endonuclease/exonuclease/phosphatase family metal-dependent hydrolase
MRSRFAALLMMPLCAACTAEDPGSSVEHATQLPPGAIRVATFNTSMHRSAAGELIEDLASGEDEQARATAEIIQRVRPDILLLNEIDWDAEGEAMAIFHDEYLRRSQSGQRAIEYGYRYAAPTNTGLDSGTDLDNDGELGGPGDAFGFGEYEGQYGFVVLSRYPIDRDALRTFQTLLWPDMPDAELPSSSSGAWYPPEALEVLRLSSKNHIDVPIDVAGTTVHLLAAHPTPPAFDGPEDRNGLRNAAEIRFWADYLTPDAAGYLRDDQEREGGLPEGERFVLCGDHNADPVDGSSRPGAMGQILDHARVNTSLTPSSVGALLAAEEQGGVNHEHLGDPAEDTGDFGDSYVGNLRLDYVLPSSELEMLDAQVFWPDPDNALHQLIQHSDHRLVWVDLQVY